MKFVEQEILYPEKVDSWLSRAGSLQKEWVVTSDRCGISFKGDENILTLWWWLHNFVNVLKVLNCTL